MIMNFWWSSANQNWRKFTISERWKILSLMPDGNTKDNLLPPNWPLLQNAKIHISAWFCFFFFSQVIVIQISISFLFFTSKKFFYKTINKTVFNKALNYGGTYLMFSISKKKVGPNGPLPVVEGLNKFSSKSLLTFMIAILEYFLSPANLEERGR